MKWILFYPRDPVTRFGTLASAYSVSCFHGRTGTARLRTFHGDEAFCANWSCLGEESGLLALTAALTALGGKHEHSLRSRKEVYPLTDVSLLAGIKRRLILLCRQRAEKDQICQEKQSPRRPFSLYVYYNITFRYGVNDL